MPKCIKCNKTENLEDFVLAGKVEKICDYHKADFEDFVRKTKTAFGDNVLLGIDYLFNEIYIKGSKGEEIGLILS